MRKNKGLKLDHDALFMRLFFKSSPEVTDEEVQYYREYPDQIDEITAPINIHKFFFIKKPFIGIHKSFIIKVFISFSFFSRHVHTLSHGG